MTDTNRKYYTDVDMDIEQILIENGLLDEMFYLKDLNQRKLFLNQEISSDTVSSIVRHIMQINKEDIDIPAESRKPILLYVSSPGGEVRAGFELIDAIETSKTPVYTINLGCEYSMAFLIGLSGHKRFAMPNSAFLMHDGEGFVFNSGSKMQDTIDFQRKVELKTKNYVLEHSNITSEEYDSKLRVEWYLLADEAKEKGFTDYIIGKDCEIDDVV